MAEQEEVFYLKSDHGCVMITASTLSSWREEPYVLQNELYQQLADFLQQWWSAEAVMPLQSSGSTGEPKIFEAEKKYMRASARMSCHYLGLKAGSTVFLALPLQYIAAKMMLVRALVGGLVLRLRPASSRALEDDGGHYDFAPIVPMQAASSPLTVLNRVKTLLLGGALVPTAVEQKLQQHTGAVFASYGMTESLSHIALRRINGANASAFYQALAGVSLAVNHEGCLCFSAPHLGIVKMQTNDVVDLKPDARFLILGRRDNIINSGGIKWQAEAIESSLSQACGLQVVALAMTHPQLGHCLALLWEGDAGQLDLLQKAIQEVLTNYQRPKMVHRVPRLPRTQSGKIARKECLAILEEAQNSNVL